MLGGRYRAVEHLRQHELGEVWRAFDEVLGRWVALVVLRPELAADDDFRRRFRCERRTRGGMPSVRTVVFDYGELERDGEFIVYAVEELIPGADGESGDPGGVPAPVRP